MHDPKRPIPVENPRWLIIPERGLYTGIAVFGALYFAVAWGLGSRELGELAAPVKRRLLRKRT